MSIRYESSDEDPEERRRFAAERNAEWEALAAEVTANDPLFQRWKSMHWSITWALAIAVFAALMYVAVTMYDRKNPQPKAFAPPFVAASLVVGVGSWLYSKRVRKIALEVWSQKRNDELKKTRA
jgi:hypothetical protein